MPRFPTERRARTNERGFTLVEILVVMVILAILLALFLSTFKGSKTATYRAEAKTVGTTYLQAISQYQADYANTFPPTSGPVSSTNPPARRWANTPVTEARRGPLNLVGEPYVKAMPDAVAGGSVGVSVNTNCTGAPATATSKHTGWVSVCYVAPAAYVRVAYRNDAGAWAYCFMGSAPAGSKPTC